LSRSYVVSMERANCAGKREADLGAETFAYDGGVWEGSVAGIESF